MGKIRGIHSSPGIYTQITDLSYAAKTMGITTLGLIGETLKGPAFEPIPISAWTQYVEYFGGTSAEKYKDTLYPRYEAPYIAKSYLTASDQMYMCRVLGLSGYNAGPAFLITAEKKEDSSKKYVVAVLRSRGEFKKYVNIGNTCKPITKYDQVEFYCNNVNLSAYTSISTTLNNCEESAETKKGSFDINAYNLGQFTIQAYNGKDENGKPIPVGQPIPVSFNAGSKDYIYNVLGSKADDGSSPVYVEEFYDYYLNQLISEGKVDKISEKAINIHELEINAVADPVGDIVTIPYTELKRKHLGNTFVCGEAGVLSGDNWNGFGYYPTDEYNNITSANVTPMEVGGIYIVKGYTNPNTGSKSYVYIQVKSEPADESGKITAKAIKVGKKTTGDTGDTVDAVKVLSYDRFVCIDSTGKKLVLVTSMSDYHEQFRCASTPWIVSELKGSGKNLEVKKLFRFHTISDGNTANAQVKISIANIRPDDGLFDVYIRDFNDSDASPVYLEVYRNLNMVPGDSKYIGYKIGTYDGSNEQKSKYVTVEVIENDMTETCVPCGFLGYPVRTYDGYTEDGHSNVVFAPEFNYNVNYYDDIREKRQFFGLSDITGVDVDMLYYKGKDAYTEEYGSGYTKPFHLDSTLSKEIKEDISGLTITIDGDEDTAGIEWAAVSPNAKFNISINDRPIIGSESDMENTIYEDKVMRKFTVYPYGGFDGWDVYRKQRTTTDEFRANKYKGTITNGNGKTFSKIENATALALSGSCITSDYYAFLAGANQFEIPEKYVINLMATPGIDYVKDTLLSNEILEMVEEKRYDTLYVMTTPDKPAGATDDVDEMYSASEAAENLEDAGIDSYYACTYYPWVKYHDKDNNVYINLPVTKDVLRNMANTDNKRYPWYAPAGIERGDVECEKMHFFAKLEDEDAVYNGRINPVKTFSKDGVKVWGNKTMYICEDTNPMNRVNCTRLMLYMRKLIIESTRGLIFDPNDSTLKDEFRSIVEPILTQIKTDRGITDFKLNISQTKEEMDAHEMSCKLWVKPTPALEYLEINFMVTPQGVEFED